MSTLLRDVTKAKNKAANSASAFSLFSNNTLNPSVFTAFGKHKDHSPMKSVPTSGEV